MEEVGILINYLTKSEDLRQDLWVHYLSGNPISTFIPHLEKKSVDYSEDLKIKYAIWHMLKNPPSDNLDAFLDSFSEFERSIISSLMLGLSIKQISCLRSISEVRLKQTICNIRYNKAWGQFHGFEEKFNQ